MLVVVVVVVMSLAGRSLMVVAVVVVVTSVLVVSAMVLVDGLQAARYGAARWMAASRAPLASQLASGRSSNWLALRAGRRATGAAGNQAERLGNTRRAR